ncbi:MAG: hypothetical protein ABI823_01735 [Bryobacteraceae bacterium]
MMTSISSSQATNQPADLFLQSPQKARTETSFDQQLADALKQYLTSAGVDPAKVQISISPAATGQNVGGTAATRQLLVTVTNAPATSPSAGGPPTSTPSSTASPSAAPTVERSLPPSLGPIHIIQPDLVPPAPPPPLAPATEADRYWAAQPKPVQELRFMDDPGDRRAKAYELASAGYQIDVPIMVWDWDPKQTMDLRKMYGYTWVPSALQDPVKIAPGLTMPGVTPYDPTRPPAGSILVNTDFA